VDGNAIRFVQAFSGQGTTAPTSHPNVNEWAFFAQDSWRVNDRLTLNLGLRYDYFGYRQPTTKNTNAALVAAGYDTSKLNTDPKNVAPRIGFALKVLDNDRLVIRGGYGIYYGRTSGLLLSTAILQNGIDVLTYTVTSNLPKYPNLLTTAPGPAAPPDIYVMDPKFTTARTNQLSLQGEVRVDRNSSVTVGYLGVFGTNLTRTRDVNLFPETAVSGFVCPTAAVCTAAEGTPITYYRHNGSTAGVVRPNTAFGRISVFDSKAESYYNGAFVQYSRRFADGFQALASYTWSHVIDTRPDELHDLPEGVEARAVPMPEAVVRSAPAGSSSASTSRWAGSIRSSCSPTPISTPRSTAPPSRASSTTARSAPRPSASMSSKPSPRSSSPASSSTSGRCESAIRWIPTPTSAR